MTRLKFSGTSSALGRLALANPDRNGPPPPAFWQMSGDADFAFFDRGIDPSEFARGRDLVAQDRERQARRGRSQRRRSTRDRRPPRQDRCRRRLWSSQAGSTRTPPSRPSQPRGALGDAADATSRRDASRTSAQALLGWRVVEVDEPATATRIDAMKALALGLCAPGGRCRNSREGRCPASKGRRGSRAEGGRTIRKIRSTSRWTSRCRRPSRVRPRKAKRGRSRLQSRSRLTFTSSPTGPVRGLAWATAQCWSRR